MLQLKLLDTTEFDDHLHAYAVRENVNSDVVLPDDLCDYHVYGLYKQPILQTYYAIFDTKFIVTKYNI